MSHVAVIDYGMGNLHSVAKALQTVAPQSKIVVARNTNDVLSAERVVFPGVGALRDCMSALAERGLIAPIRSALASKPVLGICLGMQALLEFSEENDGTPGLGVVAGRVQRFPDSLPAQGLKVPHMGWNEVQQTRPHPVWEGIADRTRFYFVHSYYVAPTDATLIAGSTDYGVTFAAALAWRNVFAVQFHPEKSQSAGLALLANFLRWQP